MDAVNNAAVSEKIADEIIELALGLHAIIGSLCTTKGAVRFALGLIVTAGFADRIRDDLEEVIRTGRTLFIDRDRAKSYADTMIMKSTILMIGTSIGILSKGMEYIKTARQTGPLHPGPGSVATLFDVPFPIIDMGNDSLQDADPIRKPIRPVFYGHAMPHSFGSYRCLVIAPFLVTFGTLPFPAAVTNPEGVTTVDAVASIGSPAVGSGGSMPGKVRTIHFSTMKVQLRVFRIMLTRVRFNI